MFGCAVGVDTEAEGEVFQKEQVEGIEGVAGECREDGLNCTGERSADIGDR